MYERNVVFEQGYGDAALVFSDSVNEGGRKSIELSRRTRER
jgi:hypothetical protein